MVRNLQAAAQALEHGVPNQASVTSSGVTRSPKPAWGEAAAVGETANPRLAAAFIPDDALIAAMQGSRTRTSFERRFEHHPTMPRNGTH
jgi:hypothetical protein